MPINETNILTDFCYHMTEIANSVFSDYKKTNQHITFYDCHVAPWCDKKIYHFHIRGLNLCKVQKQPSKTF